ncbi:hypothetical protein FS749_002997, partial [Ceratobasidium sp. UAMH 11750]
YDNTGERVDDDSSKRVEKKRTPLPVRQLFVLCLTRIAEPISFSVIFPFVNQMVEEIGVTDDPKTIGYYSGLVEGLFALAQFCTVWFWGSLSDRIGRRPVLIFGLCGVIGSTISFGLSKSFHMMLISRTLSGALNGNVAVIKSVMGEITDETNQGAAFAYLPLCWSTGALIAPALGGFLSHPAERYPSIFSSISLLRKYPFFLPCLAGASLSTIGLIAAVLFLEESLVKKKPKLVLHPDPEQHPLLPEPCRPPEPHCHTHTQTNLDDPAPSIQEILCAPAVQRVLVPYGFMALITASTYAVFILWLYTPVELGGTGFSSGEIGGTLALSALFETGIAVIVFPPLERRLGVTMLFKVGMMLQAVGVLTFPLGHAIAKTGKLGAYIAAGAMVVVRGIAGIVFVCNMLMIARSAPSHRALGTVNGLAQMVASASRATGPPLSTSLFAYSIKSDVLGGNLVWLIFMLVALLGIAVALRIPSDRPKRNVELQAGEGLGS